MGRVGHQRLPKMGRVDAMAMVTGKVFFVAWSLVIPAMLQPVGYVLAGFALMCATVGVVLATTFQLAHCVEEAEFADADSHLGDWAEHQMATTVDFAMDNGAVTWLMGGLNFQVVHHLFPKVCHLHYPAIARILTEVAREQGVEYRTTPKLAEAIAAHYRWLRRMGPPAVEVPMQHALAA